MICGVYCHIYLRLSYGIYNILKTLEISYCEKIIKIKKYINYEFPTIGGDLKLLLFPNFKEI
jgi:hypothetical protein